MTAQQTAAALWIPSAFGYARTVNGPSSIAAVAAVILVQTVSPHDNPMKLMSIAMRPLSQPPFPLERIEEMTALMGGDGALYHN